MNSVNLNIVELERTCLAMHDAILELLTEWDFKHAHENHQTGYTLDTYGIQLARQAIAPTKVTE